MAVGMAARHTEAVESLAARKNRTQWMPISTPLPSNHAAPRRSTRSDWPQIHARMANPGTEIAVRHATTAEGGSSISFPRIAVSPHARTTR